MSGYFQIDSPPSKNMQKPIAVLTAVTMLGVAVLVVTQQFGFQLPSGGHLRGATVSTSSTTGPYCCAIFPLSPPTLPLSAVTFCIQRSTGGGDNCATFTSNHPTNTCDGQCNTLNPAGYACSPSSSPSNCTAGDISCNRSICKSLSQNMGQCTYPVLPSTCVTSSAGSANPLSLPQCQNPAVNCDWSKCRNRTTGVCTCRTVAFGALNPCGSDDTLNTYGNSSLCNADTACPPPVSSAPPPPSCIPFALGCSVNALTPYTSTTPCCDDGNNECRRFGNPPISPNPDNRPYQCRLKSSTSTSASAPPTIAPSAAMKKKTSVSSAAFVRSSR